MTLYRIQFAIVDEYSGKASWIDHRYAFCSPKAALGFASRLDDGLYDGVRIVPPVPEDLLPEPCDLECPF